MTLPLPTAVWEGEFKIGSFKIRAYVLSDGRRLLSPEDVSRFFADPAEWPPDLQVQDFPA